MGDHPATDLSSVSCSINLTGEGGASIWSVVTESGLIARATQQFSQRMQVLATQQLSILAVFSGKTLALDVHWSEPLGIWMCFQPRPGGHWNAFGVQPPVPGKHNNLTCTINFPRRGINRRMAGVVGSSSRRSANLIAHRGRIGAGRSGVGRRLLGSGFTGHWQEFIDDDQVSRLALVGNLEAEQFPWQVADFVKQVERIKQQAGSRAAGETFWQPSVSGSGTAISEAGWGETEELASCNRGLISSALLTALTNRGLVVSSHPAGGIYAGSQQQQWLLEVLTDHHHQSVSRGLGQLMLWRGDRQPGLVLPVGLAPAVRQRLLQLGVRLLEYRLDSAGTHFSGLEGLTEE